MEGTNSAVGVTQSPRLSTDTRADADTELSTVKSEQAHAAGGNMKQDKTQPELDPRAEQAKAERAAHEAQDSRPSATAQQPQRVAPPRKPLFGK